MQLPTTNKSGYNGNPFLKKPNQALSYTDHDIQEYIKCKNDIIYFAENYMTIIGDKGPQKFTLYPYQKKMLKMFVKNKFNIVTTARQAGKSTTTCAFILWYVIFNEAKTVGLLANKAEIAHQILGRVKYAYELLPAFLQQGVIKFNEKSISLENKSEIVASATSSDAVRGYTFDIVFIDEAAFIENWDEFYTSTFSTITSRSESKVILVSTPNGLNHFYSIWENAQTKDPKLNNGFKHLKVIWSDVPGRDQKWFETTLGGMNNDMEKFNQEHCAEFLGSSQTLIAGWKLKELVTKQPLVESNLHLKLYEKAQKNHTYLLLADVSHGKGLDYSAFSVIDISKLPYIQVCTFRSNTITPADYAEVIVHTAKTFNDAFILIEINDVGLLLASLLHHEYEYENILSTTVGPNGATGKVLTYRGIGAGTERGIRQTSRTKKIGCVTLKLLIEQNHLIVNDKDTIDELKTFAKKGNSYEAEKGKHDDLVMSLVSFGWVTEEALFKNLTDISTLASMRDLEKEQVFDDLFFSSIITDPAEYYTEQTEIKTISDFDRWMME